jgi:hypothetical protein
MFGFKKAVVEFMESQMTINTARQQVTEAHQHTFAAMSRRLDLLEEQVASLESQVRR